MKKCEKLTPKQLEQVWRELTASDAVKGSQAIRLLLDAGDQAVEFLQNKIGKKAAAAEIDKLIDQLNDSRFVVRSRAEQRLLYQTPRWLARIEKAKKKPKSLEQLQRIERILAIVRGDGEDRSFFRRWARADYVLQFAAKK